MAAPDAAPPSPVSGQPPARPIITPRRLRRGAGLALLGLFVIVVAAGPALAPYRAEALSGSPLESPTSAHLLGTNALGQDVASQLILGTRVSVLVAVLAGLGTVCLGGLVGVTAGWFGGGLDLVAMRFTDLVLVIPKLPLLLLVGALTGGAPVTLALLIAATFWPMTARVLRSQVLSLRNRTHIKAAKGFGARNWHLLRRHILPDLALLVVAELIPAMSRAVTLQAGLAFLGVGNPTQPSWGTMMHDALNYQSLFETSAWTWWLVPPVLAIVGLIVAITLLGTSAEERLSPRVLRHQG
jgi:ABC-type dipeptide/oligopeptide/nickel transport system permease subunit